MSQPESIQTLARKAVESIRSQADPEKAGQVQRYFKETVKSYGVTAQQVRQVAAEIHKRVRNRWKEEEVLNFCEHLLQEPQVEIKTMAGVFLNYFEKELSQKAFYRIKKWLEPETRKFILQATRK